METADYTSSWLRGTEAIRDWDSEQRLRWLVEVFSRANLSEWTPEERAECRMRLHALTPEGVQLGYVGGQDFGDLAALVDLQDAIAEAVRTLAHGANPRTPSLGGWALPRPHAIVVDRISGDDPLKPVRYRERWIPDADNMERDALLFALYQLIKADGGARLYPCRICHRPFVRHRKQMYCATRCTDVAQHRRKNDRRKLARKRKREERAASKARSKKGGA